MKAFWGNEHVSVNSFLFQGRYEQAVEHFNRSYNISRSLNDVEAISSSRVLFGVAAAHKMLQNFSKHVEIGGRVCMERLLEWKDNRGDEFDKDVPKPGGSLTRIHHDVSGGS